MTAHYTCDNVRERAYIGMPINTSTDDESLAVLVINMIKIFN